MATCYSIAIDRAKDSNKVCKFRLEMALGSLITITWLHLTYMVLTWVLRACDVNEKNCFFFPGKFTLKLVKFSTYSLVAKRTQIWFNFHQVN